MGGARLVRLGLGRLGLGWLGLGLLRMGTWVWLGLGMGLGIRLELGSVLDLATVLLQSVALGRLSGRLPISVAIATAAKAG